MKQSKVTRFIRVNLIGLLAIGNLLAVFLKFKVERPQTITYRCDGKHSPTNIFSFASVPVVSVPPVDQGQSHKLPSSMSSRSPVPLDLKEAECDYLAGVADGVPILQAGNGRYYKRGDLTRWGRVSWIGADFFTTERFIVKLKAVLDVAAQGELK